MNQRKAKAIHPDDKKLYFKVQGGKYQVTEEFVFKFPHSDGWSQEAARFHL